MSISLLLSAAAASPTEKMMHTVHEVVGWGVLALAGAVLMLGGARTYFLHGKSEQELVSAVDANIFLKTMSDLRSSSLGVAYHKLVITGGVGLCTSMYRRFEVGVVDRLNYVIAKATRELSVLLYRYVDAASIDGLNYLIAAATKRLSDLFYKYAELSGIDGLNYLVANGAVGLSSRFRKTHTGVLSYNMTLVGFAFVAFLIISLYFGGFLR